jgi:protoporphyrinogen/coproporphyrinogen III oxidase
MSGRVIVIGAGMAGLSAAWSLSRQGVDVTVLERDARVGGRVLTADIDGTPVELGAGFLANFYPKTLHIARDVGLVDSVVPAPTRVAVLRGGRLHGVSAGQLLFTSLIPFTSKLRLLKTVGTVIRRWGSLDQQAMWRAHRLDTRSVAAYAKAALDEQILDYILEPGLRAYLYWEPEQTTQAMLFIMLKQAVGLRRVPVPGGRIAALPAALARTVPVQLSARVREVRPQAGGGYAVRADINGVTETLTADGVVCATTATQVPVLFGELTDEQHKFFGAIRYSTTVSVAIPASGPVLRPYTDVLMPRRESGDLAAATRRLTDGPPGSRRDVLLLFASSDGARRLATADADAVTDTLLADFRAAVPDFAVELEPGRSAVQRWPEALPVFDVGHLRALRSFHDGRYETGSLVFAGDYIGGPFIEGAVGTGLAAADRLLARMKRPAGKR